MPTIAGGNRGDCNEAAQPMRADGRATKRRCGRERSLSHVTNLGRSRGVPTVRLVLPHTKHFVPSIVASDNDEVSNSAGQLAGRVTMRKLLLTTVIVALAGPRGCCPRRLAWPFLARPFLAWPRDARIVGPGKSVRSAIADIRPSPHRQRAAPVSPPDEASRLGCATEARSGRRQGRQDDQEHLPRLLA